MQEIAGKADASAPVGLSGGRNERKVTGEFPRKRVLVVDDNANIREMLSRLLSWYGFEVDEACSGLDALTLLNQNRFQLVLTDLQMPGMDGLSLSVKIRKRCPATPIILITGMERQAVERRLKSGSIDFVLYKPFALNELEKVIVSGMSRIKRKS